MRSGVGRGCAALGEVQTANTAGMEDARNHEHPLFHLQVRQPEVRDAHGGAEPRLLRC
jgi:hypothetical protein